MFGGAARARGVVVRRVPVKYYGRGLRIRSEKDGCALGVFRKAGEFWPATISILSLLGDEGERQVLIHEMIHCWLSFERVDVQEPHGPQFVLELERLAKLGEAWATEQVTRYRKAVTT